MLSIKEGTDHIIEDETQIPYRLRKILGFGHSGTVAEVEDQLTGRVLAQKTISVRCMKHKSEKEQTFANEVSIIRRLQKHHHMIQVFSTYMTDRAFNLVLDPVADSGNLHDFLITYRNAIDGDRGTYSPDIDSMTLTLEQAFGCLASGIAFMHNHNIRHKDIKPQNILIHKGRVIFTDFGYSLDFNALKDSESIGPPGVLTRRYAAPEVLACPPKPRNRSSDVFSLGCVFIEILSALGVISIDGPQPFSDVMAQLHEQLSNATIAPYRSFLPGTVIMMTLRNPASRWKAHQILNETLQHPGFSCGECLLAGTKCEPQAVPRFIEQSCQTDPILFTPSRNGNLQSLSENFESQVLETPTTMNTSATVPSPVYGAMPCLPVPWSTPPRELPHAPILFDDSLTTLIEAQRETLEDARNELLASRFQLVNKRRELRALRERSAQQEGAAVSLVQRYLQEQGIEMPASVANAISECDKQRATLALQEPEYEEAEELYSSMEWSYTQQESNFISNLETSASQPLASIFEPTSELPHHHNAPATPEQPLLHPELLCPESVPGSTHHVNNRHEDSRPKSELQLQWSDKRRRIDGWLLESLKSSSFEKSRYKDCLKTMDIDITDHDWWQMVENLWDSSISYHNFHTGDSTVSGTSPSLEISSKEKPLLTFHISDTFRTDRITDCTFEPTENPLLDVQSIDIPPLFPYDIGSNDLSMDISDSIESSNHGESLPVQTKISRLSCSFSSHTFGSYSTAPTIDFLTSGSEGCGTDIASERGGRPIRTMTSPMSSPLTRSWPVELFDISPVETKAPLQRITKLRQEVSSSQASRQPSPTRSEALAGMNSKRFSFPILRLTPSLESLHPVTRQDDTPFVFAPNAPFKLPGPSEC